MQQTPYHFIGLPPAPYMPNDEAPSLVAAMNMLIDPLEELDDFIADSRDRLQSNEQARRSDGLAEFHCDCERRQLLRELAFACEARTYLAAVIASANQVL